MKHLIALVFGLLSTPAFASHPHDRVCVGSAKGMSVDFVFQYELGRNYDHGGPNEDSHTLSFSATTCYGDYQDTLPCEEYSQADVQLAPGKAVRVPVKLVNAKGEVFFEGTFDGSKIETLVGKMNKGPGRSDNDKEVMGPVNITLACVSQPRMKLTPVED